MAAGASRQKENKNTIPIRKLSLSHIQHSRTNGKRKEAPYLPLLILPITDDTRNDKPTRKQGLEMRGRQALLAGSAITTATANKTTKGQGRGRSFEDRSRHLILTNRAFHKNEDGYITTPDERDFSRTFNDHYQIQKE
jgi:hypothetical protein